MGASKTFPQWGEGGPAKPGRMRVGEHWRRDWQPRSERAGVDLRVWLEALRPGGCPPHPAATGCHLELWYPLPPARDHIQWRFALAPLGAHDLPDGRCNAFALLRNGLPRRCAPGNPHVFSHHHKRKASLSSARRSRRISCTGLPCRNPPARDPSPLAQDDMSGVRRLFHSNAPQGPPGDRLCAIFVAHWREVCYDRIVKFRSSQER